MGGFLPLLERLFSLPPPPPYSEPLHQVHPLTRAVTQSSFDPVAPGFFSLSTRAVTQGSLVLETVTPGFPTLSTRAITQGSLVLETVTQGFPTLSTEP